MSDRPLHSFLIRALLGVILLAGLAGCASTPVYTSLPTADARKLVETLAGTARPKDVKLYERYVQVNVTQSFDDRWPCNKSLMIITSSAIELQYGPDNSFTGVRVDEGDCRSKSQDRIAGRYDQNFLYIYYPDDPTSRVLKYEILRLGLIISVDGVDISAGTLYFRGAHRLKNGAPDFGPAADNPYPINVSSHGFWRDQVFHTGLQPVAESPFTLAPKLRQLYMQSFGAAAAEISRQRLQERRESEETLRQGDRAYMAQLSQSSQPAFVTTQQQVQQQLNRQAEINREQLRMAPPPAPNSTPAPKPTAAPAAMPVQRPTVPTVAPGVATMTYAAGTSPGRPAGDSSAAAGGNNSAKPAQAQAGAASGAGAARGPSSTSSSGASAPPSSGADKGNAAGSKVASASGSAESPSRKRELQYERQNVTVTANWKQCELSRDSAKQWAETTLNSERIGGCRKLGTGWLYEKM